MLLYFVDWLLWARLGRAKVLKNHFLLACVADAGERAVAVQQLSAVETDIGLGGAADRTDQPQRNLIGQNFYIN
jgi:hypothetical protein